MNSAYIKVIFCLSMIIAGLANAHEVFDRPSSDFDQPEGDDVFKAVMANSILRLKNEPFCNDEDISLADHFSRALSASSNSGVNVTLKSSCKLSKFETGDERVIDIWDCNINIADESLDGEYIANTSYTFGLTIKNFEFVNGSLRCL